MTTPKANTITDSTILELPFPRGEKVNPEPWHFNPEVRSFNFSRSDFTTVIVFLTPLRNTAMNFANVDELQNSLKNGVNFIVVTDDSSECNSIGWTRNSFTQIGCESFLENSKLFHKEPLFA